MKIEKNLIFMDVTSDFIMFIDIFTNFLIRYELDDIPVVKKGPNLNLNSNI